MGVLRLIVPAGTDWPGVDEITGGRFALSLEQVRDTMTATRDRFAERQKEAPRTEWHAQKQQYEGGRIKKIAQALEQIDDALQQGEDLEHEFTNTRARLPQGSAFDSTGASLILDREFLRVECGKCKQSFAPTECEVKEWSVIAGPRMGIGGKHLVCPAGHTLFYRSTWIS